MSRSILKVASRAVNANVQNHDNVVTFLQPIGHKLYAQSGTAGPTGPTGSTGSSIEIQNPGTGGFLFSDGTSNGAVTSSAITESHNFGNTNIYIQSDTLQMGNYSTNAIVTINGGLLINNSINQVISMNMYDASGINQQTLTDISSTNLTLIAQVNYYPKSYSTNLYVEYYTTYTVGGNSTSNTDAFESQINIITDVSGVNPNPLQIGRGFQQWLSCGNPVASAGVGTRSGTIFPIVGSWIINTDYQRDGSYYTIQISAKRTSGDDVLTVNGDIGTWLKITEILNSNY
jgi:hypothetical protein